MLTQRHRTLVARCFMLSGFLFDAHSFANCACLQATSRKTLAPCALRPCPSAPQFTQHHEGLLTQVAQQTASALRAVDAAAALQRQRMGVPAVAQAPQGAVQLAPMVQQLRQGFKEALGAEVRSCLRAGSAQRPKPCACASSSRWTMATHFLKIV